MPTTESVARATSLNGGAPTPVIQVRELGKSYGPVEAVQGVDITVDAGEIVAFLGPNGAGKTTTMEILAGHRQRDAGEVSVPVGRWDPVAPGSRRRQREPDVSPAAG